MNYFSMIIGLFIGNSIAHIISFLKLNIIKSPDRNGVLVFVFINAFIALTLWQEFDWARWLALIFPLIGGLGLFIMTIIKGKGKWIDYLKLLLDVLIIILVLKYYFL